MSSVPSFSFPKESRPCITSTITPSENPIGAFRRSGKRKGNHPIKVKVRKDSPHPFGKFLNPLQKIRFGSLDPNQLDPNLFEQLNPIIKILKPHPLKLRIPSPLNPRREADKSTRIHRIALPNDELLQRVLRCNCEEEIKELSHCIADFIIQGQVISPIHIEILTQYKREKGDPLYTIALKTWTPEPYWSTVNKLVDEKIAAISNEALNQLSASFEGINFN